MYKHFVESWPNTLVYLRDPFSHYRKLTLVIFIFLIVLLYESFKYNVYSFRVEGYVQYMKLVCTVVVFESVYVVEFYEKHFSWYILINVYCGTLFDYSIIKLKETRDDVRLISVIMLSCKNVSYRHYKSCVSILTSFTNRRLQTALSSNWKRLFLYIVDSSNCSSK